MRILVVDDDHRLRKTMCEYLERSRYEVSEADNGESTPSILGAQDVDVVVSDIVMPTTNGIEVAMQVRENHPSTKLIAISRAGRGHWASWVVSGSGL